MHDRHLKHNGLLKLPSAQIQSRALAMPQGRLSLASMCMSRAHIGRLLAQRRILRASMLMLLGVNLGVMGSNVHVKGVTIGYWVCGCGCYVHQRGC
eukprot:2308421-Pyramimonas_sp.AAC.1